MACRRRNAFLKKYALRKDAATNLASCTERNAETAGFEYQLPLRGLAYRYRYFLKRDVVLAC